MKNLKEYLNNILLERKEISQEDIDYLNDICDTEELENSIVFVLSENDFLDIVVKMVKADKYSNGHYTLEDRTDDWDEYDWDDDQQLLINYADENEGDIYELINDLGDFSQPVGLVVVVSK